jgi:uncharacterized lipoprotein YajG
MTTRNIALSRLAAGSMLMLAGCATQSNKTVPSVLPAAASVTHTAPVLLTREEERQRSINEFNRRQSRIDAKQAECNRRFEQGRISLADQCAAALAKLRIDG